MRSTGLVIAIPLRPPINSPRHDEPVAAISSGQREFAPDLVRAVATVLLVMLHGLMIQAPSFGPSWWALASLTALAKLCVPLFLLLNGYLMMRRPIADLGAFYRHRFGRILLPLVFATVLGVVVRQFGRDETLPAREFVRILLGFPAYYHLWFLLLMLPLTLATPWLQQLAAAMTPGTFRIFLWSFGLSLVWPTLSRVVDAYGIPDSYFAGVGYAAFLVIGGRLGRRPLGPRELAVCLWIFALIWIADIFGTRFLTTAPGERQETLLHFLRPQVVAQSVVAFLLLLHVGRAFPVQRFPRFCSSVRLVSRYSLGIYLLHAFVLDVVWSPRISPAMAGAGPAIHIPVAIVASLGLSVLIARLPLLRRAVT